MFHLKYWGGVQNDGLSAKFLGTDQQDFWFETAVSRRQFRDTLKNFAEQNGQIVCFKETLSDTRTIAVMMFEYRGNHYPLEYDFGVGYDEDSARYMFEDGNYACDCNRSNFLSEKFEVFKELYDSDRCGEEIEMVSFRCEFRPV